MKHANLDAGSRENGRRSTKRVSEVSRFHEAKTLRRIHEYVILSATGYNAIEDEYNARCLGNGRIPPAVWLITSG